ncbi:hypothetical protein IC229_04445 [Spirosoma sp. BT702]|uniref:Uncharacterized protein n=1 Tax=Spirosoma profusum TaxID=2771354 RepID=A0A926XXN8_9BACT|nr:hypothetical protein [Spirosoma profusum]MBD2699872.1 hypothetical protein [Spirosoma profusum]
MLPENLINHPQITIGDYAYYDDFETVENFQKNVRYLFDFTGAHLTIGKFCMIASGVEFIMNGANHLVEAVSSYPFAVFGGDWSKAMDGKSYPQKGNTFIGNDVWIVTGPVFYRALPSVMLGWALFWAMLMAWPATGPGGLVTRINVVLS